MRIPATKKVHLDLVIGIDPDVDKNGVALLNCNNKLIAVSSLTFPALLDFILYQKRQAETLGQTLIVAIEAGWLNKSNWHLQRHDTKAVAVAKGVRQGRNEQVSRIIGQMCERYDVRYEFIKPLKKCWHGENGKITHEELAYFAGIGNRTNQEERDAALIAWIYAGFAVRAKPITSR